jgi:hypothetical protein
MALQQNAGIGTMASFSVILPDATTAWLCQGTTTTLAAIGKNAHAATTSALDANAKRLRRNRLGRKENQRKKTRSEGRMNNNSPRGVGKPSLTAQCALAAWLH